MTPDDLSYIEVTADNVGQYGVCCIKDRKASGFKAKLDWFRINENNGLKIVIAVDPKTGKEIGFVEFIPSENAWRPVKARNYLFIHCITLYQKNARNKNIASRLIALCEQQALNEDRTGVCVMTSNGTWMANKSLFEKNGYEVAQRLDRFELMFKKLKNQGENPAFINWENQQSKYPGWQLIYSDQCPWHDKVVGELVETGKANGVEIKTTKLMTPEEAQKSPSGFGVFAFLHDGKLLADHYISKTRLVNILKKELPH